MTDRAAVTENEHLLTNQCREFVSAVVCSILSHGGQTELIAVVSQGLFG